MWMNRNYFLVWFIKNAQGRGTPMLGIDYYKSNERGGREKKQ